MTDITEQLRVWFCTEISTMTLESAAKTIDRLHSENENLRKALADKVVSQTMLRELSVGNRSINAAFEGGAAHLLADAFADQFLESEATNYLEVHLHSAATGPLVVTLQRVNGKTPHQLRAEAEKERDEYTAAYNEWREKTEWVQEGINSGAISSRYLGWHRADITSDLLKKAEKERDAMRTELKETWHRATAAENTIKALRAKIEQMEKQEPHSQYAKGWNDCIKAMAETKP